MELRTTGQQIWLCSLSTGRRAIMYAYRSGTTHMVLSAASAFVGFSIEPNSLV